MPLPPAEVTAASLHHVDALPAGTRLAEFEVQALMGVGGFGMVYRAYDHSLHRTVAIKEYMPSAMAGRAGMSVSLRASSDERAFGAGLRSFMAEARLLAQFDHPSLVKVFRVWEQNRTAYMVMPFYHGVTLKQARAQMRMPPPEDWLRKLLWSVLEALKVLHRHHTVHRDVSPDNIFLQDVGPPVLLDLGAARRALGDRTQRHTAILKVNYAPIEQYADAEDMRQGPWSDLYALCAVVHGCLSNAPPLPSTFRVLRDRMPALPAVVEGLHEQHGLAYSASFVDALTQGLAIQPADRPQSVAAFAELLQLQTPPDIERFDWRAELGDIWQPSRQFAGLDHYVAETQTPEQHTLRIAGRGTSNPALGADEHAYAETMVWPVPSPETTIEDTSHHRVATTDPDAPARPPATSAAIGPGRGSGFPAWSKVAVGGVVLGLLGAVGLVSSPSAPPADHAPPVRSQTAPVAPAAPPVPAVPAVPAPLRLEPASPPASAAVPALDPEPPAPASSAPAAPQEAPRSARAPRALTAEQICPDSNFVTRPMCLFRECQKPAYARMPVCVDNNRRLQENNRNNAP